MDSYSDPSKPRVSEDKEHGAPYRCTVPTNPSIYKASKVILGKVKTWSWQCLLLSSFSVISIATFVYQKRTILFWKWLLGSLLQDYVVHCTVIGVIDTTIPTILSFQIHNISLLLIYFTFFIALQSTTILFNLFLCSLLSTFLQHTLIPLKTATSSSSTSFCFFFLLSKVFF